MATPSPNPRSFFHITKTLPATAVAAALTLTAILKLDANPSLYLYDMFLSTSRRKSLALADKRVWIAGASSTALAEEMAGCGARLVLSARSEGGLASVRGRCIERRRGYLERRREEQQRRGRAFGSIGARAASKASISSGATVSNERSDGSISLEECESGVFVLPLDVTAQDSTLTSAVDSAISAHSGIDILVLNAGRGQLLPSHATPSSIDRELMEINYHSPIRLAQFVMSRDGWTERRSGHIVVTSSVAGKMAVPLCASYAAAKHAVMGYFNTLRAECAGWGLRVDLACPGPVDTDFGGSSLTDSVSITKECNGAARLEKEETSPASKMSAPRCASLIVSSIVAPRGLMTETWISRQPALGFTYLSQNLQSLSTWLLNRIGPVRIKAWEMGLPLYDASSWAAAARELKKEEKERIRMTTANEKGVKKDD
eukprot:CAMPEP_0113594444 /NCGR_PEP_ID=MMETSP0015_2-20120614/39089_1 /TAXON_ID=2838 /ORGANISM="Odontella" /LENGTH=430 /DNA_ID=CAMNT_0000501459 /DNA_START=24 /DNA_END=1316 /DNA_ORIENTATION=+ /assembly_acc=CAM_ASM_000160